MKALDYVSHDEQRYEGYDRFIADPDVMYPAAIEYARALVDPGADVPMYLQQHVGALRAANPTDTAWDDALAPAADLSAKRRADRQAVLEAVRLIFTARLREQAGGPINLAIQPSTPEGKMRWRL
jgi:hypothetical protein